MGMAKTGKQNLKHIFVINDTIAILELFTALLKDEATGSRPTASRSRWSGCCASRRTGPICWCSIS